MKSQNSLRRLRPKDTKSTLLRLFGYFRFNKLLFFGGIFFIIVSAASQIAANAMLSPIIDTIVIGDIPQVVRYLLIMGAIVLGISGSQYLGNLFMARLAQETVHKIREDMFSHMQKLPVSYFDKLAHGDLMSTFTNDVDMLNQSLEQSVSQAIVAVITVAGSFAMMLVLSPILTLTVILMLGLMFAAVKYVGRKSASNFRFQQAALADMNGYVEEIMSGQKVVKVFNYEERAIDKFLEKNEQLRRASTQASTYGVMLMPIMGNLSRAVRPGLHVRRLLVMKNSMTIGNIAAFLQYTRTISGPLPWYQTSSICSLQPWQGRSASLTFWMKKRKGMKVMSAL